MAYTQAGELALGGIRECNPAWCIELGNKVAELQQRFHEQLCIRLTLNPSDGMESKNSLRL